MAAFKAGDRVRVVDRETTPEDARTELYYDYFGGLTGSVDRVYDDGCVCVDVDIDSLSEATRERHYEMQEEERQRWLEGLSNEMRNKLTPEQKQFNMSYKILVGEKDLEKLKGGGPSKKSSGASGKSESSDKESEGADEAPESIKRASEADLSKAEEEFLRTKQSNA